jgi:hypothetical protein
MVVPKTKLIKNRILGREYSGPQYMDMDSLMGLLRSKAYSNPDEVNTVLEDLFFTFKKWNRRNGDGESPLEKATSFVESLLPQTKGTSYAPVQDAVEAHIFNGDDKTIFYFVIKPDSSFIKEANLELVYNNHRTAQEGAEAAPVLPYGSRTSLGHNSILR